MERLRGWRLGVIAGVLGGLIAIVLGLVTVGVQATVEPRGLPLAVAVPGGPAGQALTPVADRLRAQSGDAVAWTFTDAAQARALLENKEVFGVLQLTPAPGGRGVAATVVVSGAVNPTGTQAAQQVLTAAGQGITSAVAQQVPGAVVTPVAVETLHPVNAAGRTLPLAASVLLWLGTLVASAAVVAIGTRGGRTPSTSARLAAVGTATVVGVLVVLGFGWLWDSSIVVPWSAIGFLALVAFAFAAVQGAVLRLMGLVGMAILVPLYLLAPAVAGLPGELLQPAYRVLLWSWSPFRFSTEATRSLLFASGTPPDVAVGVWVFVGLAVAGLVVLLWPGRRRTALSAVEADPTVRSAAGSAA